ncbi:unnamed protein product [Amoebophrya sp. A120]|nr:unnamed protein product [Amoebophrya sp. A120]|eukprot:GSA120T00009363001.1
MVVAGSGKPLLHSYPVSASTLYNLLFQVVTSTCFVLLSMGFVTSSSTPGVGARDATIPRTSVAASVSDHTLFSATTASSFLQAVFSLNSPAAGRESQPLRQADDPPPCQTEFDRYVKCARENTMTLDMLDCEDIQCLFQRCMKEYKQRKREDVDNLAKASAVTGTE